jgi:hypothetical protein
MNAKTGVDIEALMLILKQQQAEIIRLLEKVNHLERMIHRTAGPVVQRQSHSVSARSVPRRWCVKGVSITGIFAVMLGSNPTLSAGLNGGPASGTSVVPRGDGAASRDGDQTIVPSPQNGTVPGTVPGTTMPNESGLDQGSNSLPTGSDNKVPGRALTPGGLETTPGNRGANISNTPSNITPATTPPLQ